MSVLSLRRLLTPCSLGGNFSVSTFGTRETTVTASLGKKVAALSASSFIAAGMIILPAPTAQAANSCRAYHQVKSKAFQWDDHRVRAICTKLNSDDKAKGTLQVRFDFDKSTVWFTGLNVNRYSRYTTLAPGEYQGVKMEYGAR